MDRMDFIRRFKTSGIIARCGYIPDVLKTSPSYHAPSATPDPGRDICCVAPGFEDAK
jgi:hypothetical protein